ncbi:hypothetical protein ABT301_30620 [Streptomyces sp. NPDC000987]|uniref:hypothetical protein n=1 Tax=Streptomyces sp. NPDC000987 TaxID=3154374 RepID=UPI00331EDA32
MSHATIRLPIGDPVALGYQFYAFPLAIQATDERASDWILSNYIQLEYDERGWDTEVPLTFYLYDYALSPWLEVVRGTRAWYASADIVEVVRNALANGYYAYLVIDEYHIPNRRFFQVKHQEHDILVHGVDDRTGTFTVLGFDEQMRFRSTEVSQEDFGRAHHALDGERFQNAPVVFYRPRAQPDFGYPPIRYDFNVELVRRTLHEYLHSIDTSRHFDMLRAPRPCRYGMDVYQPLEQFVREYAKRERPYDIRHLHILWEHKRMMTARVRRLADLIGSIASLQDDARQIETDAMALRNVMMRDHLQNGRKGYLDNSLDLLDRVRDKETALLTEVIRRIDDAGPLAPAAAGLPPGTKH